MPLKVHCPLTTAAQSVRHGVPPILHLVYGLRFNASFEFVQFAAIKSAIAVHRPTRTLFHHFFLPRDGPFWRAVRPNLDLVRYAPDTVEHAEGRCLRHFAHMADWIRLRALNEMGGLYVDLDTFSLAPLPQDVLAGSAFIIAKQLPWGTPDKPLPCERSIRGSHNNQTDFTWNLTWRCGGTPRSRSLARGLCNAIMAAAPSSRFGEHWIRQYARFRSSGKDVLWDEHSVVLPARLWERCDGLRDDLLVLPPSAFFPFYWLDAVAFLTGRWSVHTASRLRGSYVMHIWGRGAWAMSGNGQWHNGARAVAPPRHPLEPCSPAYAATVYGHLSCRYVPVPRMQP